MATDRGRHTDRSKKRTHVSASRLGRLRLAPGVQLQDGKDHELAVLVSPRGSVQLNSAAVAILRLCDGSRDRAGVVAEVVRRSRRQLQLSDIGEFLDAALAREWIVEGEGTGGRARS